MCVGGGGHSNCNASLSQPNIQKNSRAPVKGRVEGLKFEKIRAEKQLSPHLRKNWAKVPISCIFYFFIHPQPNNIGPARPMGGGTLIFSSYVGSGPVSTFTKKKNIFIRGLGPSIYLYQKKIRNFKHPKKVFDMLTTQKISPILYLDLKKRP